MKVAGDFSQHNQPRGGENVSLKRESEGGQINDLIDELALNRWLQKIQCMAV